MIYKNVIILGKNFEIGEYCTISSFVHIWAGKAGVKIGNRVMIASNVSITSLTHDYTKDNIRFAPIIDKSIIIEDDVWIGANSVILPGITLGKGSVIGAGSVVTKNVSAFSIVVGVPAKEINKRPVQNKC